MLKLVALLGAAALLAGCVAVPDDGYGYGYAQPYYPGGYAYGSGYAPVYGTVNVWGGNGWRDRDHWHGGDDRWHGGWRGGGNWRDGNDWHGGRGNGWQGGRGPAGGRNVRGGNDWPDGGGNGRGGRH